MKYCKACGHPAYGAPHHIRSRGAGGGNEEENLIQLCHTCHTEIHTIGWKRFTEKWPLTQRQIWAVKYHDVP